MIETKGGGGGACVDEGRGRGVSYLMPLDGVPLRCAHCDRRTSAPSIPFCSAGKGTHDKIFKNNQNIHNILCRKLIIVGN